MKTLGNHLRKKRLDLKLLQKEVAEQIGVDETTVHNWETNRTVPSLIHIPKIIKFIGYVPWKVSAKNIKRCRQVLGISQKTLARQLGVDPGALARWESGRSIPVNEPMEKLYEIFSSVADPSFEKHDL